jgi:hypothetical protein
MNYLTDTFKTFRYGKRLRPAQDWRVLLALALALLVASVAWNLWLLNAIKSGAVLRGATPAATPAVSANTLSGIQESFATRATQEAAYEDGATTFVDPSQE